jgi:predicted membrane protein
MRIRFWRLFWGVILTLFGLGFLLNNLDWIEFGSFWKIVWPLIIIAIGIYLIYRKKRTDATSISETVEKVFGDLTINPQQIVEREAEYTLWFGDIELDLTKASFPEKEKNIKINLGFGDIKIKVPQGISLSAYGKCWAGDIQILNKKEEGIFPALEFSDLDYSSVSQKLRIKANAWFGSIVITRE